MSHPEPFASDVLLGRCLGSYRLVERIGQGGMGAIYRARRVGAEEGEEDVAVKVIKRGMDTEAILRRFETERRILAKLDHVNIARMLDAGATPDGVPYVVMEFIAGQPIHRYCDSLRLPVRARLELFRKVCAAVECAHALKIIHRDIKPENVLVTPAGEPKLVDFGIAKILAPDGDTHSQERTITLAPLMTPHYASPEQTEGAPLTPATDIYSLGVMLYEVLAGVLPYRNAEQSRQGLIEAIRGQRPEPPSSAVRRAADACALRSASAVELRAALRGVDAIVLTNLEKDPARRYGSVAELSADIELVLAGRRPVARRFRRIRRAGLAAVVALLSLAAVAGGWWYRARSHARVRPAVAVVGFENLSHQQSTDWLSTALTEMVSTELEAGGGVRTVSGELVSRVKMELALANSQTFSAATLGRLHRSLGADYVVLGSYLALGDASNLQLRVDLRLQDARSGNTVATVSEARPATELAPLVASAGARLRRQLGVNDPAAQAGLARASVPEGAEAARNYAEGLERLRNFDALSARDLLRNAVVAAPSHALSHAALAAASGMLGYDLEARDEAKKALDLSAGLARADRLSIEGRYWETVHNWDRAVATYETLHREYSDNVEYGLRLAAAQTRSGAGRRAMETIEALRALPSSAGDPRLDLAEGEAALAASDLPRALGLARRAAQQGSSAGLRILAAEARLLESRTLLQSGEPQAALTAAADSQQLYLAAGHRPGIARALLESAGVLTQLGDITGARARYEEAMAVCRAIGDQSCIATGLDSSGVLRRRQGDLRGALDMHQQALEIRRKVGDSGGAATSLYNVGNALEIVGDLPHAREAAEEALAIRRQLGERRSAALTLSRLANIRRRMGELSDSTAMNKEAVATLRSIGDRGGLAMGLYNLGVVRFDTGDLAGARAAFQEALGIRRQQRDRNNSAQVLAALAGVALEEKRLDEARIEAAESLTLREQLGEALTLAQSKLVLSRILLAEGRATEAEKTAQEAGAAFRKARAIGPEADAALDSAAAQLGRSPARARASLDRAGELLRDSRDARLTIRRNILTGRLQIAEGRGAEGAALLESARDQAARAGYLLLARKAQE